MPQLSPTETASVDEIRAWLIEHVARELHMDPGKIDPERPLTRYGLDSLAAVTLSGELEIWLQRELPPELVSESPTINGIATRLADSVPVTPRSIERSTVHADLDHSGFSPIQNKLKNGIAFLTRLLCRMEVEGIDNIPENGSFILAANHLHILDAPLLFGIVPRPIVLFASDHMRRVPMASWFLKHGGNAIFVRRGEGDQDALASAMDVLRGGGGLAVAPEGKISKTGGLLPGQTGVGHLAVQSGSPIVPLVMYGQEKVFRHWLRLRRVPIHVRIGPALDLPSQRATARLLETYRDTIMNTLARMLPVEYRGVYRQARP